jgi:hypothetical protein
MTLSVRHLRYLGSIALLFVAIFVGSIGSSVAAQDPSNGGAVFKMPDGYMRAPLSNFKGLMTLDPKKAAGIFVTYPNDNETTEALSKRLLDFIGPMFIHDKGTPKPGITWSTSPLVSHPGDGAGKATVNIYTDPTQEVQVVIYERTTATTPLLYGYFAMRNKPGRKDDGKFLDDNGKGIKAFDKLWESIQK